MKKPLTQSGKEHTSVKKGLKRPSVIAMLTAAAVTAVAAGLWTRLSSGTGRQVFDTENKTVKQLIDYFSSQQFKDLSPAQRRLYARQATGRILDRTAEGYFQTPADKRTAYLDRVIDDIARLRQQAAQRRARYRKSRENTAEKGGRGSSSGQNSTRSGPGQRNRNRGPESLRSRQESVDAVSRAKRTAFLTALRQRMSRRGMQIKPGR